MNENFVDQNGEIDTSKLLLAYNDLAEQFEGSMGTVMTQSRQIGQLKRELDKVVQDDDPQAEEVKGLLRLWWVEVMGSDKRVKYGLSTTRAATVKKAAKRRGAETCRRAILGVKYDDWAMGRIRKSQGKTFNDIAKHILFDDETIERFVKLYDHHQRPTLLDQPEEPPKPVLTVVPKAEDEIVTVDGANLNYTVFEKAQRRTRTHDTEDPITRVLSRLEGVQPVGDDRWEALCPAHDDHDPSLSIARGDTGCVLVTCWAGCDVEDVVHALDLEMRDLWDGSERDLNARGYVDRGKRRVPAHLAQAMLSMLGRDEREAA